MAEENNEKNRFEVCRLMSQEDVDLSDKVSPEYRELALRMIKVGLGYMPTPNIFLPHLALSQSLHDNYIKGVLSDDTYATEQVALNKRVRNDDVKKGGWLKFMQHDQSDYDWYNSELSLYKDAARIRLCTLMGYEPSLDYSLEAEVYLRQLFESDKYYADMPICDVDMRAITITRYREVFMTEGETAADDSVPIGYVYIDLANRTNEEKV